MTKTHVAIAILLSGVLLPVVSHASGESSSKGAAASATSELFGGCRADAECPSGWRCRERDGSPVGTSANKSEMWKKLFPPSCQTNLTPRVRVMDCVAAWGSPGKDDSCWIDLQGEISAADASALQSILKRVPNGTVDLTIDSPGGDVDAAIGIGRALRSAGASAGVAAAHSCASACVLVLAGAVDREVWGPVVIHRPYRATAVTIGSEETQRVYKQRRAAVVDYLREMNVPESLYDAMSAIPPESGRVLTRGELRFYHLNGPDPAYREEMMAREAVKMGLSMSEYVQRLSDRDACIQRARSQEDTAKCYRQFRGK